MRYFSRQTGTLNFSLSTVFGLPIHSERSSSSTTMVARSKPSASRRISSIICKGAPDCATAPASGVSEGQVGILAAVSAEATPREVAIKSRRVDGISLRGGDDVDGALFGAVEAADVVDGEGELFLLLAFFIDARHGRENA